MFPREQLQNDQRSAMRALRDQAVALEHQLKEEKRRRLLERLQMDFDQLAPVLRLNANTSMLVGIHGKPPADGNKIATRSLPVTPVYEGSVEELHGKFLQLVAETKDKTISDNSVSVTSTDLSPYMQNGEPETGTDADTCCSETTEIVPAASSDSETTSLECSTPVKPQGRIRRLSYTLEAPSPVLLKQMQTQHNNNESVGTSNKGSKLIFSIADSLNPSNCIPEAPAPTGDKISPKIAQPLADVTNGHTELNRVPAQQYPVIFSDFLQNQQKLMQDLLDQQAKEQERLAAIFKEQEKQLMMQLQVQQSAISRKKSPARRNLQSSFDSVSASKFSKLTALVRGYLTRRLMATDRVQEMMQTIRDTTTCLRELDHGNMTILPSDIELHRRLVQQLAGAVQAFHEVFFGPQVAERMMMISRDREKKLLSVNGTSMKLRPRSRSLSSATVKSLERKLTRRDSGPTSSQSSSVQSSSRPSSSQRESRSRPWSVSSFNSVTSTATSATAVSNGNFFSNCRHLMK